MAFYKKGNSYLNDRVSKILTNSATIANGDLVSESGGFLIKATTGTKILGIADTNLTAASDNQTVAKATVLYRQLYKGDMIELAADASLAQTDEGKYFNINSDQTVDVATASVTNGYIDTTSAAAVDPVVYFQLKLVKFVSQAKSLYEVC